MNTATLPLNSPEQAEAMGERRLAAFGVLQLVRDALAAIEDERDRGTFQDLPLTARDHHTYAVACVAITTLSKRGIGLRIGGAR